MSGAASSCSAVRRVVGGAQLGDGVGGGVAVGVRGFGVGEAVRLAEGGDLLELVAALLVEIFFKLRLVHGIPLAGWR